MKRIDGRVNYFVPLEDKGLMYLFIYPWVCSCTLVSRDDFNHLKHSNLFLDIYRSLAEDQS